jgi:hypothetical protein
MDTNIPAELLDLKARFDEWNKTRKCIRSRIPDDLRLTTIEMLRRYPSALISDLCRISRSTLNRLRRDQKNRTRNQNQRTPSSSSLHHRFPNRLLPTAVAVFNLNAPTALA